MELIPILTRLGYYIFALPVLLVAGFFASFFFPVEGDKNRDTLIFVFSTIIFISLIALFLWWLQA